MNSSSHDHQPSSHDDHEMENILSQIKDQLSSHLQPSSSSQNENEMVVDDETEYEMVEISFNPSHDKIIVKFKKSSSHNQPSSPVRRSKRKRKNSSHQEEEEEEETDEMVDHETDKDYHILNGYISLSSDHEMVDRGETENEMTVMVEGENERIKEILSSYISK